MVYGWQGMRLDTLSGNLLSQSRFYNIALQRWGSNDPVGLTAGDPNTYRMVENRPSVAVDWSGHGPTYTFIGVPGPNDPHAPGATTTVPLFLMQSLPPLSPNPGLSNYQLWTPRRPATTNGHTVVYNFVNRLLEPFRMGGDCIRAGTWALDQQVFGTNWIDAPGQLPDWRSYGAPRIYR